MKVTIDGIGQFEMNEEGLPQLLALLSANRGVKVQESNTVRERSDGGGYTGRELLSEG